MARERLANSILPNAATMIGVCVTAVGLVKVAEAHIGPSSVDNYCAMAGIIFLVSAFCSYVSLRRPEGSESARLLERVADFSFMLGLLALTVIILLFAYEVI
ncbi:MAG: hypothetical protein ACTHLR_09310 [Rhizomicrobium sp.]